MHLYDVMAVGPIRNSFPATDYNVPGSLQKVQGHTEPQSMGWLLSLKGTAGGDMSRVREWSCVGASVRHRVTGPGSDVDLN